MATKVPAWDPEKYLKFEHERTLPCHDLVGRIELVNPSLIADLGCGPGNSTAVLAKRWPRTKIVGVDISEEMLNTARSSKIPAKWTLADLRHWKPESPCDLIFSNATLHWIANQRVEIKRLLNLVTPTEHSPSRFQQWGSLAPCDKGNSKPPGLAQASSEDPSRSILSRGWLLFRPSFPALIQD